MKKHSIVISYDMATIIRDLLFASADGLYWKMKHLIKYTPTSDELQTHMIIEDLTRRLIPKCDHK